MNSIWKNAVGVEQTYSCPRLVYVVPYRASGERAMASRQQTGGKLPALKYRRIDLSSLRKGRRGKHHDLVEGILDELKVVKSGSALEIPLAEVNGIGLANLRSAVHRASSSAGLDIETLADEKNFYVWKAAANNGSNGS